MLGRCKPAVHTAARYVHSTSHTARPLVIDLQSLKGKHVTRLGDLTTKEIHALLQLARGLRKTFTTPKLPYNPLVRKRGFITPTCTSIWLRKCTTVQTARTMAMIFQKRSTRTRVSTETGIAKLGGHALFLGSDDIQLGKNETMRDTATVLSGYNDIILARVFAHDTIAELCKYSTVPVINGLSDTFHPLQGLADLQTLQDHFGRLEGLKVAWVGDGNNIAHTLLEAAVRMNFEISVATPVGYECNPAVVADIRQLGPQAPKLSFTSSPLEAVKGANAIVTDTWVSMGQEAETNKRLEEFRGYQVTEEMAAKGGADPSWVFLHCLPRKPYEVDDHVFYSKRSLVFPEAQNRMWTVMALALAQLEGGAELPIASSDLV